MKPVVWVLLVGVCFIASYWLSATAFKTSIDQALQKDVRSSNPTSTGLGGSSIGASNSSVSVMLADSVSSQQFRESHVANEQVSAAKENGMLGSQPADSQGAQDKAAHVSNGETGLTTRAQWQTIVVERHLQQNERVCWHGKIVPGGSCNVTRPAMASMDQETRDAVWADAVETKISEHLARPEVAQVLSVHDVECRQTMCAVQVLSKPGSNIMPALKEIEKPEIAGELVQLLGMETTDYRASPTEFMFVSLVIFQKK